MHTRVYVHVRAQTHACTVRMRAYLRVSVRAFPCSSVCACIDVCVCVCMHECAAGLEPARAYICMYL